MVELTYFQLALAAEELANFPADYPLDVAGKLSGIVSAIHTVGDALSPEIRNEILGTLVHVENLAFQAGKGPDDPATLMIWRALWRCGMLLESDEDNRFWVAPDFVVVAIPIEGSAAAVPQKFRALVSGFEEVVFFDRNQLTYPCSTQAAYHTIGLQTRYVLRDPKTELADEIQMALEEIASNNPLTAEYHDRRSVDSLVSRYLADPEKYPFSVREFGSFGADWVDLMEDDPAASRDAYEMMMDNAREEFQANSPL